MKSNLPTQSTSNTHNSTLCDFNFLTQTCGSNTQTFKNILATYLTQLPEEFDILKKAVNENELETIKRYTHKLKSSVGLLRISEMVITLQEMEKLAGSHYNQKTMKTMIETLLNYKDRVLQEIKLKINAL
ncbi:MAG: Hpt domain-containing protein [Paludibacteraceae bacterium]|nr:Hpt domain-containing protein [Paludibacteraceae bacterium]MBN2786711.1 Hpt domain-containing protein [Paludibacteraceae bacterium]